MVAKRSDRPAGQLFPTGEEEGRVFVTRERIGEKDRIGNAKANTYWVTLAHPLSHALTAFS